MYHAHCSVLPLWLPSTLHNIPYTLRASLSGTFLQLHASAHALSGQVFFFFFFFFNKTSTAHQIQPKQTFTRTSLFRPIDRMLDLRVHVLTRVTGGVGCHKTMSTDHNVWKERSTEAESNRGHFVYQRHALPLGQIGSLAHPAVQGNSLFNVMGQEHRAFTLSPHECRVWSCDEIGRVGTFFCSVFPRSIHGGSWRHNRLVSSWTEISQNSQSMSTTAFNGLPEWNDQLQ